MSRSYMRRALTHPERGCLPPFVPLIIPNDREYDASTNELRPVPGERRSGLKIVPETLRLLESIERPVAVASICGPTRTGKSYILSRMLGSAGAFELGHTMDAKTFGIWIGTTVLDCDEFTLLFMDTEGIDVDAVSSEMKDDASVLVMTVLLSSCLIYNSIQLPRPSDLPKMSQFAQLGKLIAAKDVTGDSDDSSEIKSHFPDFLWLLRDVTFSPAREDGKHVTPTEYLMTRVLRQGDLVGRAILTFFPTIECKSITPPSADPTVLENLAAAEQNSLHPQFNQQVKELAEYLLQRVQGKKGIRPGMMADGPILAAIATIYLKAINTPNAIPCISETWQAAIKMKCMKVKEQLLQEYDHKIGAKVTEVGLPMEEDSRDDSDPANPRTLLALHRSILLQKTKALLEQVGHFVSGSATAGVGVSKESLSAELQSGAATFTEESTGLEIEGQQVTRKKVTGGKLFKYAQDNYKASHSSCTRLFEELYASIEEKMKQADQSYSFDELIEQLRDKYYREAVGPAKSEVYKEKHAFIETQAESYNALQGFKKKRFEAQQEASAATDKLQDSLQELLVQMKEAAQMNQKRLQELEEHHREEMERVRKEERQRSKDFLKAQMEKLSKANGTGDMSQSDRLSSTDLLDVCDELSCVCAEWEDIGLALHLDSGHLDGIKGPSKPQKNCLRDMVKLWLNTSDAASWSSLVQALQHRVVGQGNLAAALERKYLKGSPLDASQ